MSADLLAQHTEAIAQREHATTAGSKAATSRKIALLELEMTIQRIEFTPWEAPRAITTRKQVFSDDQLASRIAEVRSVAEDSSVRDSIRATASNLLGKLINQAAERGIEVAPAAAQTKRASSKPKAAVPA